MTEGPKHDVFISFARGDRVEEHYVRAIVGLLRGYNLTVKHDETDAPKHNLTNFMQDAVDGARWVLPVLTPKWKEAFGASDDSQNTGVEVEAQSMKERRKREGTWATWTVPMRPPGAAANVAPAALSAILSRAVPSEADLLLADVGHPGADNAPAILAALFALARTLGWDLDNDPARRVRADIDRHMATFGSAFESPFDPNTPHAHRLSLWAQHLAVATRHDPDRLLPAVEAILDAFSDAGLSAGDFGVWANEHYKRDLSATRRPWVLRLTLVKSDKGLKVTAGTWLRGDGGQQPIGADYLAAQLASEWRKVNPPAGVQRDLAVLSLETPYLCGDRPDLSPAAFGKTLRDLCRAVTFWPTDNGQAIGAQRCPGCGTFRLRPTGPRTADDRLQVMEGVTLSKLTALHDGHVLTVGADDPDGFAALWRDANGLARTLDAFQHLRDWVASGHDALLVWTDKDYELHDPMEP